MLLLVAVVPQLVVVVVVLAQRVHPVVVVGLDVAVGGGCTTIGGGTSAAGTFCGCGWTGCDHVGGVLILGLAGLHGFTGTPVGGLGVVHASGLGGPNGGLEFGTLGCTV